MVARDGHDERALALLAAANTQCPDERSTTWALELSMLSEIGQCSQARSLAAQVPPGSTVSTLEATATCDAIEAPAKGTAKTFRAKMREAHAAELAKDFVQAKALYLDAWAEQHTPRPLEGAARVAALGGDAPTGRRLSARALTLAEAATHQVARVTSMASVTRGNLRVVGDVVMLSNAGAIAAYDLKSGDTHLLLQTGPTDLSATISTAGGFAVTRDHIGAVGVDVYDLLTGELAFKVDKVASYAFSPDDTLLAVSTTDGHIRVIDTMSGEVSASFLFDGATAVTFLGFTPDRAHLTVVAGHSNQQKPFGIETLMRVWDVTTKARVGGDLLLGDLVMGEGATSRDGHWYAYQAMDGGVNSNSVLRVRDMVAGKAVADLPGSFFNVHGYAISDDGKSVATGSRSSLRLWDVARKKQTFKLDDGHAYGSSDLFTFSNDGTAVIAWGAEAQSISVATGAAAPLPISAPLAITQAAFSPDGKGAALVTARGVYLASAHEDWRAVCEPAKGDQAPPLAAAFSHDSKSFACATGDGKLHVYDVATWVARSEAKVSGFKATNLIDVAFAADDQAIALATDQDFRRFDAQTGAELAAVTLSIPRKPPPKMSHAHRAFFHDGTFAVPTGSGAAWFDARGAFLRNIALPTGALAAAFSEDGKTYVGASATGVDIVDLATGVVRNVPLTMKSKPKAVAISGDGHSVVVLNGDELVTVAGSDIRTLDHVTATRAWFVGRSLALQVAQSTIELRRGDEAIVTLEAQSRGVLARSSAGELEARGMPSLVCVVGGITLDAATCAERARADVIATWLERTKP